MLLSFHSVGKWLKQAVRQQPTLTRGHSISASMLLTLAEADLPAPIRACPVALKYHRLLHDLDWQHFPERDAKRAWPGPAPDYPRAAFVAAFPVKLDQQHRYMSDSGCLVSTSPTSTASTAAMLLCSAARLV